MNTEKPSNEEQSQPSCLGDVSGSFSVRIAPLLKGIDSKNVKAIWL